MNIEKLQAIDKMICEAAKNIKVLSHLSWPANARKTFLAQWHKGNVQLPTIEQSPVPNLSEYLTVFATAEKDLAAQDDPLANFLRDTARSYITLCQLLQAVGTRDLLTYSKRLYGGPGDSLSDGRVNNLDAAKHFLDMSDQYCTAHHLHEADYCLPAHIVRDALDARLCEVFPKNKIQVVVDANLASKAAAGATRIRLRDGTCFSEYDLNQLLQHEAFVHSLTALNGRAQANLQCLSLGAPRTTQAQEGLATFAEIITGSIDIDRMQRIALRVVAIDNAMGGADFIDVFRFFLEAGQSEMESFNSAMRIFRGAPLTGGSAFTKDVVYLHGLMEVHTFFRWAMQHQRLELCRLFFAGRMTIDDAINLEPLFSQGLLSQPTYLPPWMTKTSGLAGYLAFAVFANKISIERLDERHRFDTVEQMHE